MLYALADEIRREEGCVTESAERVEAAAERLDTLTVTIRGMEIMLSKLQSEFNLAMSKVEAATAAHPNAVRFLLDEAIEIWGQAVVIETKPDDGAHEEELHL
jgi:hypothetical protein